MQRESQCEDSGLRLWFSEDSLKQSENKMAEDNWVFDSLGNEKMKILASSIDQLLEIIDRR